MSDAGDSKFGTEEAPGNGTRMQVYKRWRNRQSPLRESTKKNGQREKDTLRGRGENSRHSGYMTSVFSAGGEATRENSLHGDWTRGLWCRLRRGALGHFRAHWGFMRLRNSSGLGFH